MYTTPSLQTRIEEGRYGLWRLRVDDNDDDDDDYDDYDYYYY